MFKNKKIFRKYVKGTKKIVQDTIFHNKNLIKTSNNLLNKRFFEEDAHSYLFSYKKPMPICNKNKISYVKNYENIKKLKKLSKGHYFPEIFIDVHGLNQNQTKKEIGKLFYLCHKEQFYCAGIIHGHGKNTLKQQIPLWLIQHPDTIAFYRSNKSFKKYASILVLIDIFS